MENQILVLGTIFFLFNILMIGIGVWEIHRLSKKEDIDTIGPIPMGWKNWSSKRIAVLAILIALAVVASLIPIPSPTGTVALDMGPAYFAALYAGPINGLIIAVLGHMAVALRVGFPLTIPVHLGIAIAAAGVGSTLWFLQRRLFTKSKDLGLILAIIIAIIGNTFGTNILLIYLFFGTAMAIGTIPPILVGSTANVIVGAFVWRAIRAYQGGRL